MHECPECGQACDCDQDDTWFDDLQTMLSCTHQCDGIYDEDDSDDFDYEGFVRDNPLGAKRDAVELSVEQTGAGVPLPEELSADYVPPDVECGICHAMNRAKNGNCWQCEAEL